MPKPITDVTGPSQGRLRVEVEGRARTESALQTSEYELRMLVQGVKDYAIFMLDANGYVRTWNTGAERIKGYRSDEIIGEHFSKFYPPDDLRDGKPQRELKIAAKEGTYEEEGWRVRKDGTRFWASVLITALRSNDGALRGFAKVTRDLTERRNTTADLRATEERFRTMVDAVKDYAIFMLDHKGRVQSWTRGAERIKGYQPGEIIGAHFSKFYPEEDIRDGKPERELEIAARDGKSEEEGWRVRKDGSRFWASALITAIHDQSGALSGFVKVTRDVTERRESERIRSIVENVVDGIVTVSALGIIESFNPAAEKLFGYRAEETLGKHIGVLVQDGAAFEAWVPTAHGGSEVHQGHGRRKDGSTFQIELAAGEFHLLGRRVFTAVVRDVTERRRAEERLRFFAHELKERNIALLRSNQELDDFAYIASHDLKEPLRGIHNYANFLIEDYAARLDEEGRAKLETLAKLAQRMERLIDSLLEFSRVGRLDPVMQETDTNEVLRQALLSLQITLKQENVDIRVPKALPRIRADRGQLTEVFQNLVSNAAKYNDKAQKWVEIGAEDRNGQTAFYVRDNGIGIPQKHHESIFRIFKRLHGRHKFGGGTGAGLTIVKKIIERHGGRIWPESAPGEGTTFYFTLAPERG
jgi:PAS domain S-box-containing protein